jgi:hypothetical protein
MCRLWLGPLSGSVLCYRVVELLYCLLMLSDPVLIQSWEGGRGGRGERGVGGGEKGGVWRRGMGKGGRGRGRGVVVGWSWGRGEGGGGVGGGGGGERRYIFMGVA